MDAIEVTAAECPCCQSEAAVVPHIVIKRVRYRVQCENDACGLTIGSFADEEHALSAWNTRTTSSAGLVDLLAMARCKIHPPRGTNFRTADDHRDALRDYDAFIARIDTALAAHKATPHAG